MSEMIDVYIKQIRSILEVTVPVWQAGPTKHESINHPNGTCSKNGFSHNTGRSLHYENALDHLKCDKLSIRRIELYEKFAK